MKLMKAILICLGAGLLLATAPFAGATTVNFTTGTSSDGTMGNSLCYNSSGASTACNGNQFLTVTAWGVTGGAGNDTTFQQGALGHYAGTNLGLGVCNQIEGVGCSSPQHEVDNSGHLDFVLFTFNSSVNAAQVVLNPVCDCGFTDSTYYTGNLSGSISGKSLSQLGGLGLSGPTSQPGGNSQQTVTISGIAGGVNSILIGADVNPNAPHFNQDFFKIGSITYTPGSSVPEPGSLTSLGLGLGLLGWFGKRRMAKRVSQN
jgi:PEP-CTERM motif